MPALTWDEICADRSLADLPYKIETNRHGQIVMSPARHLHSRQQSDIHARLAKLSTSGYLLVEAAVQTTEGVKVADVAWGSDAFQEAHAQDETLTAAPDLCVEVYSPTNSKAEMQEKVVLYFAFGAKEVWVCDMKGRLSFYVSPTTVSEVSALFPQFPAQVVGQQ
ncbi:Uma2 family endonuclease [Roseimicrobium gellanilyticum]|uniref:Uma2 family endonuclease n=1 Tax=Roseimicrobium gellanilyticum TaxID=748857 RepID=A0A366HJ23_9BACT|nr:Uma2 family endonuclease [Roseimicrobium gellanilyticum]RBP42662.1 Uma2 family endonuclease [Roseimicrobium gellanilyticum]